MEDNSNAKLATVRQAAGISRYGERLLVDTSVAFHLAHREGIVVPDKNPKVFN